MRERKPVQSSVLVIYIITMHSYTNTSLNHDTGFSQDLSSLWKSLCGLQYPFLYCIKVFFVNHTYTYIFYYISDASAKSAKYKDSCSEYRKGVLTIGN